MSTAVRRVNLPAQRTTDAKVFGKVAVLMGGLSSEREVSLKSGSAVLAALLAKGVEACAIDAGADIVGQLQKAGCDRVFIALHGRGGEDGSLQGALETLGTPYTGTGVLGSALGMDKVRTKQLWMGVGIPTPPFVMLEHGFNPAEVVEKVGLPLITKPVTQGSSIGMTKVTDVQQLPAAFELARRYDPVVMAERWITGKEYTATVLLGCPLPLIRLETPRGFYDYDAKYISNDTRYICPCELPEAEEQRIQTLATRAFSALGASGWGRVDVMCDAQGNPWLLEVNTVPGMTDHSLVPMAARAVGISFEELCWRILETSLEAR